MSGEGEEFHLGTVLSVLTGVFIGPGSFGDVHHLLDFMTNDVLFIHQLSRAMEECQPAILVQHPQLASVKVPDNGLSHDDVPGWLAEQVAQFGETIFLVPLEPGSHTVTNPFKELAMIRPDIPVIPVLIPNPIKEKS